MWFAAMSNASREPWLVLLVAKLLEGDPVVKSLFANDPFQGRPPRFVRAELYRYRFTRPGEGSHDWWVRERVQPYLRPLSRDDPDLERFLRGFELQRSRPADPEPDAALATPSGVG
jgi:hypothetical protein